MRKLKLSARVPDINKGCESCDWYAMHQVDMKCDLFKTMLERSEKTDMVFPCSQCLSKYEVKLER